MSRRQPTSTRRKQQFDVQGTLGNAIQHFQNGNSVKAKSLCRSVLKSEPQNATAYHLLGVIAHQSGYPTNAVDLLSKSVKYNPQNAEALNYLGITLIETERLSEAASCFQKAITLAPNFAEAHNNLGNVLKDLGQANEAVESYQKALAVRSDYATAHNNLGCILKDLEEYDQAIVSFKTATSVEPGYDEAFCNLGDTYFLLGQYEEAIECFRKASQLNPSLAAHDGLGLAFRQLGNLDDAFDCFQRAIDLEPDDAKAYNGLGTVFHERGQLNEAIEAYQTALKLDPKLAATYSNLGSAYKFLGRMDEAISCYRQALKIDPNFSAFHSDLLFCMQYVPDVTLSELKIEHQKWWEMHGKIFEDTNVSYDIDLTKERPLRVGLVSPDFRHHPVGFLAVKLLENSDCNKIQFFCYADQTKFDNYTKRFSDAAYKWTKVSNLSDEQLCEEIHRDKIDILIDLTGHTAYNRLKVFCRKPAPLQATWCGYVCTTGIPTIDYIIADQYHIPKGEEHHYVETVKRLPGSAWCYDVPDCMPEVGPLPCKKNGYITFGSFNNSSKINEQIIGYWSAILEGVPGSKLLLKYNGMDSPLNRERINAIFAGNGIKEERVIFEGGGPYTELAKRYNSIDIALDTLPYSGGVTTCEALWMGVPVVSCPGTTYPGRHSLSHLNNIGLTECVAANMEEYVDIAIGLADDVSNLENIRAGLREKVASSSLCNGPQFAADFTNILQDIWATYLDHINEI